MVTLFGFYWGVLVILRGGCRWFEWRKLKYLVVKVNYDGMSEKVSVLGDFL